MSSSISTDRLIHGLIVGLSWASLIHHSDRFRRGVEMVSLSNFVTFFENTQEYRRNLRRAEYGDEQAPSMRAHLEKISPTTHVDQIKASLFIVQGQNDPRVPETEAELIVKALKDNHLTCWHLLAMDEGHGFQKKKNADVQFPGAVQLWKQHLLNLNEST